MALQVTEREGDSNDVIYSTLDCMAVGKEQGLQPNCPEYKREILVLCKAVGPPGALFVWSSEQPTGMS